MKANVVLFKAIPYGGPKPSLFIEAKLLPNYHIFEKIGAREAKVYGSDEIVTFSGTSKVFLATETSYEKVSAGSEFVLAARAQSPGGFLMPADILLKLASYAHYVDMNRKAPERDVHINGEERVFNLGCPIPFVFENITVAYLNI